jgi:predicted ribosomally synthesized peptide with SipW-like signal peptide
MGAVLIVVGIALMLGGSNTYAWWTETRDSSSYGVGLRGGRVCKAAKCETVAYDAAVTSQAEDSIRAFVTAGGVAFYGAFITAGFALIALCFALARKDVRGPVSPARVTGALAARMLVAAITS